MKKKMAFPWYGGKYSKLQWLLPLLPDKKYYCEPFGGSAAVLLNRNPAEVEVYNDIDGGLVNFFRVLRDYPEELIDILELTPFSREEIRVAIEEPFDTPIERARRFFVHARQARNGLAQTSQGDSKWAFVRAHSRRGMAGTVSKYWNTIEGLPEVANRLLRVQIEQSDYRLVLARYDMADTLFYCDPPYPQNSRRSPNVYLEEFSDNDHIELFDIVSNLNGAVAISGYHCGLLDNLYSDWHVSEKDVVERTSTAKKGTRTEVLWTNYVP